MQDILNSCKKIKHWVIDIRQDLHKTPELGLEEYITHKKIKNYLDEIGIEYKIFKNHTGIMAFINTPNATKTVAIRADIDALPINEDLDVDYKSTFENKMHACGHDAHTAILLGACKVLYDNKNDLNVNVKFLFQPAEETVGGAQLMIKDNCLKNPNVDYIFGLHVMPHIDCGFLELKYDTISASTDTIKITINGKSGHGAYPHEGVDAIVVAAHVITSLQTIVSRNIDPTNSVVLSLGIINGGVKENIICDKVQIGATLRTLDSKTREFAKKRINDIVKNTCDSFLANGEVEIEEGYPPLVNNNDLVDIVSKNASKLVGDDKVIFRKSSSLGAEDFSYYLEHTKGCFYNLGCKNDAKNINSPLHTSTFNIDEDCLELGVAFHILNVLSINDNN